MQYDPIAERLASIRCELYESARQAGRATDQIRLIGVSKTKPPQAVAAALAADLHDFGENTLQDARTKIPHFAQMPAQWHFLGHLQSNKAKLIAQHFQWVHSIDNLNIAERLNHSALRHSIVINGLIQVNISRDPAKHGIAPEKLSFLLEKLLSADLQCVKLRGLMTIGNASANDNELRRSFAGLRKLAECTRLQFGLTLFDELSMGMSRDYRLAVLEGATMIRIGTAIFGTRNYPVTSTMNAPVLEDMR